MHLLGFVWSTVFARHFFLLLTTTATEKIYKKSPDGKLAVTDSLRTLLFFQKFHSQNLEEAIELFSEPTCLFKKKKWGKFVLLLLLLLL